MPMGGIGGTGGAGRYWFLSFGPRTTPYNMGSQLANIPMKIKGIGITIKAVIATIFRKLASQDSNT